MRFSFAGRLGLVALVGLSLLAAVPSVEAKEGFYIGGGYAQQSLSGGLNGNKAFVSADDTVVILAGKPGSGTGLGLLLGYGFTPQVSIDFLMANTSHTAKHSLVDFSSSMDLSASLLGIRFAVPVQENLEIIGRVGLATATATFSKYTLEGIDVTATSTYLTTSEAKFSGSGMGFGAGIEYFIEQFSFSANYLIMNVSFDEASGGGISGELSSSLSSTINMLALVGTYYFK